MRVLLPSVNDPRSGLGGGWTYLRGVLDSLALARPDAEIEVVALPDRRGWRRNLRVATSVVRSAMTGRPAKICYADTRSMRNAVRNTRRPDLILISGSDLLWILPLLEQGVPTAVVTHNLEFTLFAEQAESWGALGRWEASRLKRYELAGLRQVGHATFISPVERTVASEACPELHTALLPPVFSYAPPARVPATRPGLRLMMVTNLHWWPNAEGLRWFLRDIWPAAPKDVSLTLIGPGSVSAAAGVERVTGKGVLPDLSREFAAHDAAIAPTLRGAGVRLKIVESLYNGLPVLTTPTGARGLTDTSGLRIAPKVPDWHNALSPSGRAWVHSAVPESVRANYTLAAGSARLDAFLREMGV